MGPACDGSANVGGGEPVTAGSEPGEPRLLMRAVTQYKAGGPEVLEVADVPRPAPQMTEILVRVHASGVNPTDWKTRARGRFPVGVTAPFTLGFDVSGMVEEVGRGVTIFKPGDEVFGMPRYPQPAAAYAEYVAAPARHFARKPENIDHIEAAALPLASLTAWQALVDTARVRQGQRVLVHAAAGGVGHLAVQIAKALGAYVIGTARQDKHGLLRTLGADELIDYATVDFASHLRDIDVVLDSVGSDYGERSLQTMRPGGVLVSLLPTDLRLADSWRSRHIRVAHMLVEPDHAGMEAVAGLVRRGRLRPVIDSVFPLAHVGEAHARGEAHRRAGKIVLAVM